MAKHDKATDRRIHPQAEVWRPDRPMGLARALNKAGWGTRKQVEEMVTAGQITVDGEVATDVRHPVTPASEILMDGQELFLSGKSYFAFHKPVRVVSSAKDGGGRRVIDEYFPDWIAGLQAAGRLDARTTGLMLVSNDPAWNNRITAQLQLEQEYRVQVEGELGDLEVDVLSAGIHLPGMGVFRPLGVKVIEKLNGRTVLNITIQEGKVRQIRRMFSTLRHKVTLLRRIRIGDIRLGDLAVGGIRPLTQKELQFFEQAPPPGK